MEVLNLIYHQFFFTTISWGNQPTANQYFEPLSRQTLVLTAAAIHWMLSEYATGKKSTAMIFQEEYQGTLSPSPVFNITLEATAFINHTPMGRILPPPPPYSTSPLGSELLNVYLRSSEQIDAHEFHSIVNRLSFGTPPLGQALFNPLH